MIHKVFPEVGDAHSLSLVNVFLQVQTSKKKLVMKRIIAEPEEDANQCQLGAEFQDVQCLLISEAKVLLEVAKNRNVRHKDQDLTDTMQKTLEYCLRFSRFGNKASVTKIRSLFPDEDFFQFEMAQLANLCCETADEAKAMIPSLNRKSDHQLQALLNELQQERKTQ